MKQIINRIPYRNINWLLNIWLGIMMMYHSYDILFFGGMEDFTQFIDSLGIPFPEVMAPIAKCGEFFGGLVILIGAPWIQRIGLFFIITVMFVATFVAGKGAVWAGGELSFCFLLIAIVLFFKPAPSLFHIYSNRKHYG